MENQTKKKIILFAFVITLAIPVYFWFIQSSHLIFQGSSDFFISLARISGLLAVYSVLLQLILIGRLAWLEKIFGHDKLSFYHHINGILAWALIFSHVGFVTLGYSIINSSGFINQFIDLVKNYTKVIYAFFALLIFTISIFTSIWLIKRKLKYEYWHLVHIFSYAAILLAFGHQLALGGDFTSKFFINYWYFLYIFAFANLIIFRIILPLYNFNKYNFEVEKIIRENYNTASVYIRAKNLNNLKIIPGQFIILRFLAKKFWIQAHPYTVSNINNSESIRITAKAIGDFSSQLPSIAPGTRIIIEGPYGCFTESSASKDKFLLIAGGIGITPIRALAESLSVKNKDSMILYSAKTKEDFIFKEEFKKISLNKNIKINYFTTSYPEENNNNNNNKQKIDIHTIKSLAPDFREREIYICGPPLFMKSLIFQLKTEHVPAKQIHFEKFSLG